MYRLYLDEVGTDGLTNLHKDRNRYLSLTGVAIEIAHARDELEPRFNQIKGAIFEHDPDSPIVFHRSDILGGKGPYARIRTDSEFRKRFDKAILEVFRAIDYTVITALIDKQWMLSQLHWKDRHPYHFLMEVIVEKYAQFLERKRQVGDIMPESRQAKDKLLQLEFERFRNEGTRYVNAQRIQSAMRAKSLKFRTKKDNIAGLQLCDLLAHPSHMYVRSVMGHEVNLGLFANQIRPILVGHKYDRSAWGKIQGYGYKYLPETQRAT
ncbi:DUF3800 domain-containing protein [Parasphingorhabdus sp. DH2-15]|uniref:DUF3800 domain-containing protein n=1 Tax=Parasphingorhabdus sp. DH2-15 TaxID=3444112 RepID=UPI003F68502F